MFLKYWSAEPAADAMMETSLLRCQSGTHHTALQSTGQSRHPARCTKIVIPSETSLASEDLMHQAVGWMTFVSRISAHRPLGSAPSRSRLVMDTNACSSTCWK